jgi:hypothetical protein
LPVAALAPGAVSIFHWVGIHTRMRGRYIKCRCIPIMTGDTTRPSGSDAV